MAKALRPAGVTLNSRVGLVVIALLRKEVQGESGVNKLIEFYYGMLLQQQPRSSGIYREKYIIFIIYIISKEKRIFDVEEQQLLHQKWQTGCQISG